MDYFDWVHNRIAELRIQKGVSARDMSLSLGQSESYINKIENKRTLPSLSGLIYICDYLGVTPKEFFDTELLEPRQMQEISFLAKQLTSEQTELILRLMNEMIGKNSKRMG